MNKNLPLKVKHTAYLIVIFDIRPRIPAIERVGIFSSPPNGLTLGPLMQGATLLEAVGDTYQQAHDKLTEEVRLNDYYEWTRFWLDESYEGHKVKYLLKKR